MSTTSPVTPAPAPALPSSPPPAAAAAEVPITDPADSHTAPPHPLAAVLAQWQKQQPDRAFTIFDLKKSVVSLIVRTPDEVSYRRMQETMADDRKKAGDALRQIALANVVHPAPDVVLDLFRRKPALPNIIANRLLDLAGADEEIELGK